MLLAIVAVVTVHVSALTLYVAPFLPIVTAGISKLHAPPWLKVGLTAALAVASTLITTAIAQGTDLVLTWNSLAKVAMAFGLAMFGYLVLRPTTVLDKVANIAPNTGIGPAAPPDN